jgi:GNAT superfamily N-acetyltransferase
VSLFAVFDSYLQDLHDVYRALFDADEEIKPDLGIEFAHEVLWVPSLTLVPRHQQTGLAAQVIQTAASALVTMGIVAADADLPLTLDDWLDLGFHKIAGAKAFYVWDRTFKNRYGRKPEL